MKGPSLEKVREVHQKFVEASKKSALSSDDFFLLKFHLDVDVKNLLGDSHPISHQLSNATHVLLGHGNKDLQRLTVVKRQEHVLAQLISRIERNELVGEADLTAAPMPAVLVKRLLTRFHAVVVALRTRHAERPPFTIADEYDVQDLLRALLHLDFEDIRPEEWTPSYAGGSSRMDFLLKPEQVVVEVKKTRKGLSDREIGEQLIIDVTKYRGHPDCKTLVCFVYDPEERIHNPAALQDLARKEADFEVLVVVAPRR